MFKKLISKILILAMLMLLVSTNSAFAEEYDGNLSEWDIKVLEVEPDQIGSDNGSKSDFSTIVEQQRQDFKKRVTQQAAEELKTIDIDQIKNDQSILSILSSYTWYNLNGIDDDHGGSGIGFSTSWSSNDEFRLAARAEGYGDYWAEGTGYVLFFPSSTGTHTLETKYRLTGNILLGGDLYVNVRIVDLDTNTEYDETVEHLTSGYYDNSLRTKNEQFYLIEDHCYQIFFEPLVSAIGTELSDFGSEEFDGTQRNISFVTFTMTK